MKIATDNVDADIRMIFPEKMQGMGQKVLGTLGFNDTKDNGTVFSKFCVACFLYGSFPEFHQFGKFFVENGTAGSETDIFFCAHK